METGQTLPSARPAPRSPLLRLWRAAGKRRKSLVLASACSVLNKIFDLAPPFLIGAAVDIVVRRQSSLVGTMFGIEDLELQLWVLAGFTALVWLLESVFEYIYHVLWRGLAQTIQHELRLEAYANVQRLDMAYFEDASTGGLLAVLNDDVNQLERFLDHGASDLIQLATTVLVVGSSLIWFAPEVGGLAFVPVPLILWGSLAFQQRLAPLYAAVRERAGDLAAALSVNLGGMATIKSFTAEAREVERIAEESEAYRTANAAAIRLSSAFVPLIRMTILGAFCAILVFGGHQALRGELEVGVYSVMVFITQRLLWPLTTLGQTLDLYQRAMASTRRILDLVQMQPAITERAPGHAKRLREPVEGHIQLRDVWFSYREGPPVLRSLDLDIPAGKTTAIVGSTGAGKSTLLKLLLRFYEPNTGSVTLDGVSIADLALDQLRGAIGLVSQDVFLFHGTVRDNVAYGNQMASQDQLEHAAQVAEALGFIDALPNGWNTIVGERGQKLSGGQRQRISIARAVLRDPPILILDEATSSVDNETEAAIQRSLERIAVGRTTIVIAHRLSTVRHADCIHVLEGGRVTESGTHDALVGRGGAYAKLWEVQTGSVPATNVREVVVEP